MKRQNQKTIVKTVEHLEIGKQSLSKEHGELGFASEHYHRAVSEMAYGFWEKRGYTHGASDADWAKAEAALKPLWSADRPYGSGPFH